MMGPHLVRISYIKWGAQMAAIFNCEWFLPCFPLVQHTQCLQNAVWA